MIAIIDYDAGNLTSVARAVSFLGYECLVTANPEDIRRAERVIFPGVGAAGSTMASVITSYSIHYTKLYDFQRNIPCFI